MGCKDHAHDLDSDGKYCHPQFVRVGESPDARRTDRKARIIA